MRHADRFIERIIFLDDFPNMQTLDSLHIAQNVKEVVERDLQAEATARALYEEAATFSHPAKDYITRVLFEDLLCDEESHIDFLEMQLELIGRLGLELYAQHHIGDLLGLPTRRSARGEPTRYASAPLDRLATFRSSPACSA